MYSEIYKTKAHKISGTSYKEVYPQALSFYKQIASKTKRRPYIRSRYFDKEKIFLDYFWDHIRQKNPKDRTRRLKYYKCALDLIINSNSDPISKPNPDKSSEVLYRFIGKTTDGDAFCVQIKENIRKKNKYFMSVFPLDNIC